MIYYLFEDKIYGINKNSCYVHTLNTSGKWFYREVIRGFSGITTFGAHVEQKSIYDIHSIENFGEEWSEEKIRKRLRYSNIDGGRMFDSFRDRYKNFNHKNKNFIKKFLNIN